MYNVQEKEKYFIIDESKKKILSFDSKKDLLEWLREGITDNLHWNEEYHLFQHLGNEFGRKSVAPFDIDPFFFKERKETKFIVIDSFDRQHNVYELLSQVKLNNQQERIKRRYWVDPENFRNGPAGEVDEENSKWKSPLQKKSFFNDGGYRRVHIVQERRYEFDDEHKPFIRRKRNARLFYSLCDDIWLSKSKWKKSWKLRKVKKQWMKHEKPFKLK